VRSGVVASFASASALERAYEELANAGYTRLESWTPYAVKSVVDRLPPSPVPWIMMCAGLLGGALGYGIQWWCNAWDFPIDVGGRPLNSVPAFIPITFESAVLAASVTGFVSMLALCRFPRLVHPLFGVEGFESASIDHFWLGVDDEDPRADATLPDLLLGLGAERCQRVEPAP
jgi:hypothetical protein